MQITQLVNRAMANMQAEADRRVEAALQRIADTLEKQPKQNNEGMSPSIRTDTLPARATVLMTAEKKLDLEVAFVEKTESWRELRVRGVALDRYMTEGGLDPAWEERENSCGMRHER